MIYDVTIFGIHLTLNPIAFTLPFGNGFRVYWYGVIIALGFLGALIYAYRTAPKYNINIDKMIDVVLVTTPVAILCARSYYLIFDEKRIVGFKEFFGIGTSSGFAGLAIYGGVIGAFVCGGLMCRFKKINILDMFDITATAFLLAQGVGRWGNFFNQEAYGTFTGSSFWGMESNRTIMEMGKGLVHPCFLYESIWCILGFVVLSRMAKNRKFSGQLVLMYGVWYGFGRAIIETLRTDSLMLGKIRVSCLLSVILCVGSAITILVVLNAQKRNKADQEYVSVFSESEENKNEDN